MRMIRGHTILISLILVIIFAASIFALTQPTLIYPSGSGIVIGNWTEINWTASTDSSNIIRYHLFYSNNSGTNWYSIISNYGYITSLNDTNTSENITFSGNENNTLYIDIPKVANITSAKINITGYQIVMGPYNKLYDSFQDEGESDGNEDLSSSQISFGRIGSYNPVEVYLLVNNSPSGEINQLELFIGPAYNNPAAKNIIYNINIAETDGFLTGNQDDNTTPYTGVKSNFAMSEEWGTINNVYKNMTFDTSFVMNSSKKYVVWFEFVSSTPNQNGAYTISMDNNPTNNYVGSYYGGDNHSFEYIANLRLFNGTKSNCTNVWLEVGNEDGSREWNFTGNFTGENITSDFNTSLQSYLDNNCTLNLWNNCSVPFKFHSDSGGNLEVSGINIKFTDYWWNTTNLNELTAYKINITPTNDTDNGSSSISESDFTISHENPVITLNSPPANYSNSNSNPANVSFNCSATDDFGLENISLYITNSQNISFSLNQSSNVSGTNNSGQWNLNLSNGDYTWNCKVSDRVGNVDWGSNRTIEINYASSEDDATPSAGGTSASGTASYGCHKDEDCDAGYYCHYNKCVKLFDVKILEFDSPINPSDFFDFTYFVKSIGDINDDVILHYWIKHGDSIITSGFDTIYFGVSEEKTEISNIFLPGGVTGGIYDFTVHLDYKGYSAEASRKIQVIDDFSLASSSEKIALPFYSPPGGFLSYLTLSHVLLVAGVILFLIIIFIILRLLKSKENFSILNKSELKNLKVYTEEGKKVGKVLDTCSINGKFYGYLIKIDSSLIKNVKGPIILKKKYIKFVDDVVIVGCNFYRQFKKR